LNRLPQTKSESPSPPARAVEKRTYLHVGDRVFHKRFRLWGGGIVVETWSSNLPGGSCYVRIQFQDGKKRVFDNNLDSSCCCYYAGITVLNRVPI
jgi:hypothetical protein